MHKSRIALFTLLSFALSSTGTARLWDTERQVEAQYGAAIEKTENDAEQGKLYTYRYKDFYVMVTFDDGKSQNELYIHQDQKTPFSSEEIEVFLDMNSFGQRWHKETEDPMWILGDGKAMAAYYPHLGKSETPSLGICTQEHAKRHGTFR
ncbi:MAG: hypothetical protein QOH39_3016 [Verrucomicrobiota bacterium]|jgi:hypothetical protein